MEIRRSIEDVILRQLEESRKMVVIYGARQVGKTTLARHLIRQLDLKTISISADESKYVDLLASRDAARLESLFHGYEFAFIDEAQRIPEIGVGLKILADQFPQLRILVTGSSSIELAGKVKEPLTGRAWTYHLYPFAQMELSATVGRFELENRQEQFLLYGSYPEVFLLKNIEDKARLLREISTSYLYRDVMELMQVRHPRKIQDLLRLLAFQVGGETSIHELATQLGINQGTVERYLDLLEKAFVIFRLGGFSRNLRKEISKKAKYYFWDTGIRNAILDNFRPLSIRDDVGALWENFLMAERRKAAACLDRSVASWFWRTQDGAELDLIEEVNGILSAYEFKYSPRKPHVPASFVAAYPGTGIVQVNRANYLPFLGIDSP